jgi:hypothetical protein
MDVFELTVVDPTGLSGPWIIPHTSEKDAKAAAAFWRHNLAGAQTSVKKVHISESRKGGINGKVRKPD